MVEKIAGWRHSGFSAHSKVKARTRGEVERVGKYMIRPFLSLERLSLDEREGKVTYRYGESPEEVERMDYLEFIARVFFVIFSLAWWRGLSDFRCFYNFPRLLSPSSAIPPFFAQVDIHAHYFLSFMTMGGGQIGA
jgi:hypothetical protein